MGLHMASVIITTENQEPLRTYENELHSYLTGDYINYFTFKRVLADIYVYCEQSTELSGENMLIDMVRYLTHEDTSCYINSIQYQNALASEWILYVLNYISSSNAEKANQQYIAFYHGQNLVSPVVIQTAPNELQNVRLIDYAAYDIYETYKANVGQVIADRLKDLINYDISAIDQQIIIDYFADIHTGVYTDLYTGKTYGVEVNR